MTGFAVLVKEKIIFSYQEEFLKSYLEKQNITGKENIAEVTGYYLFDNDSGIADYEGLTDRVTTEVDGMTITYHLCDRASLVFELRQAARSDQLTAITSRVSELVVTPEQANGFLEAMLADKDSIDAEEEWFELNGENLTNIYLDTYQKTSIRYGQA